MPANLRTQVMQMLTEIRRSRQVDESDIAQTVGFPADHLSDLEMGKVEPRWSELLKLAQYHEVSIRELIAEAEPMEPTREQEEQVMALVQSLLQRKQGRLH